jgi:hypothetical protein
VAEELSTQPDARHRLGAVIIRRALFDQQRTGQRVGDGARIDLGPAGRLAGAAQILPIGRDRGQRVRARGVAGCAMGPDHCRPPALTSAPVSLNMVDDR